VAHPATPNAINAAAVNANPKRCIFILLTSPVIAGAFRALPPESTLLLPMQLHAAIQSGYAVQLIA
jgi:hypothetical protein